MNAQARKKLVASLLSASKQAAVREAAAILAEPEPSLSFVRLHLKRYITCKFMLEADCAEDRLMELASLSLQRTMKLDRNLIRELDQAAPCDHATSESTKKVLLLYAIQKDLSIHPEPSELTEAVTVQDLALVVYRALKRTRGARSENPQR